MNIPVWILAAAALLVVAVGAYVLGKRTAVEGAKPWWASRTVLFNAFLAILGVMEANSNVVRGYLGPSAYVLFSAFVAAVNVYLRFGTTQPVK